MARILRSSALLVASAVSFASCGSTTPTITSRATTTVPVTRNLVVTAAVRHDLLAAGARLHQLPTRDYVGLDKGTVYFAFDPANGNFYAAAGLNPSPNSLPAQVGSQDDGAYNLFVRHAGSTSWTVYNDGLGAARGSACPVALPASVLAVWGWKPKSCFPPL